MNDMLRFIINCFLLVSTLVLKYKKQYFELKRFENR